MGKTKTFEDYEADIRKFHAAGDIDKAPVKVENIDFVICQVCGKRVGSINNAHLSIHNMTFDKYHSCFPDACVVSEKVSQKMRGPRHHIRGDNSPNWIE